MRTFLVLLLLFALAAVVGGLLAHPVWTLLQLFDDSPIHRVMNRVGMLVLAVTTLLYLRRKGLADKETLGYALPRPRFIRQMLWGFGAGVLLVLPVAAALFGLELRTLSPGFSGAESPVIFLAGLIVQGLLTGLVIAFIEETYFRGALFTAVKRESGLFLAIALPTLWYATMHFLGSSVRIPRDEITYWSGLQIAANLFDRYANPLRLVDSFLALIALGVLLSFMRQRTGAIAACIGLHAGGVGVILVVREISIENPQASLFWLVGSHDGVIGWMMAGWITVMAAAYWYASGRMKTEDRRPMAGAGNEVSGF